MDRQDTFDLISYYTFLITLILHLIFSREWLLYFCIAWLAMVVLPALLPDSSRLRYQAFFLSYTSMSTTVCILYSLLFMLRPCDPRNMWYFTYMEKVFSKLYGLKYELRNLELLAKTKKAVIVVNHQSIIDVFGLSRIWHEIGTGGIIAKRQLFYYWPVGLAAWLAGVILIEKNQTTEARKQFMEKAKQLLLSNDNEKASIVIFPEGKRSNGGGELLTFKKGAFWLAHEIRVPIVPVVLSPFTFVKPYNYFKRGKITITILDPIDTSNLKPEDIDGLAIEVRERMNSVYTSFYSKDK